MRTDLAVSEVVIRIVFAGTGGRVFDELTAILGRLKDGNRSREGGVDVVEFVLAKVRIGDRPVRVRIHGLTVASPPTDAEFLEGADALALVLGSDEVEKRASDFASWLREHLNASGALGDGTPMTLFVVGPEAAAAAHSVRAELRAKGLDVMNAGYSGVDGLHVLQKLCEQVVTWHRDPLGVLASLLHDGRVPKKWFEAHGQALEKLWHNCSDGRVLMRIAVRVSERATVARAACACVRTALAERGGTASMEKALGVAEAHANGTASSKQFKIACRPLIPLVEADSSDLALAIVMAGTVLEEGKSAEDAVDAAARVMSANEATVVNPAISAAIGAAPPRRRSKSEALAELAALIRAHIEVPDLEAVRSAAKSTGGR